MLARRSCTGLNRIKCQRGRAGRQTVPRTWKPARPWRQHVQHEDGEGLTVRSPTGSWTGAHSRDRARHNRSEHPMLLKAQGAGLRLASLRTRRLALRLLVATKQRTAVRSFLYLEAVFRPVGALPSYPSPILCLQRVFECPFSRGSRILSVDAAHSLHHHYF